MPLFSVLIANFNNGRFLKEALESVYKQTYTNWEIIIVDDYSTDNSLNIYKTLENNSKVKIYFNGKNEGVGYTKRRCIEEANGEICGFLDPDDALTESALEEMVKCHLEKPEVALIHSKMYICDEKLHPKYIFENPTGFNSSDPYFFNIGGYINHFVSFKKSYYLKTEGLDAFLKRAIDQDLYLKLCEVGATYFIEEVFYYYRIHKNGISTYDNVDKAYFWFWNVIIAAGRRRNINLETLFNEEFIRPYRIKDILWEYERLKKYQKLNNLLAKIRSFLK